MIDPPSEEMALSALIDERLAAFAARLGPHLATPFHELLTRLGLDLGVHAYFNAPFSLPVLHLPVWVARAVGRRGCPVSTQLVDDIVECAAMGYLHVRVQDDFLDERIGHAPAVMLLSDALFVRHQTLLAHSFPQNHSFWTTFESTWLAYGDAMLQERELHAGRIPWDAATFDQVLRRSAPLVLPSMAIVAWAGMDELWDDLEQAIRHLVRGHQLFHDLVDTEEDLSSGNITWLLARMDGGSGLEALRRRLFLQGGFDQVVEESLADLDRVRVIANRLDLPELATVASRRRDETRRIQREAFQSLFSHMRPS